MFVLRLRKLLLQVVLALVVAFLLAGALVAQTTPMCQGPLSKEQVVGLLKGSVSPRRVQTLVEQCGVNFDVSDDVAQTLGAAGADDALILTVRQQASPTVRQGTEHVRRGDQAFADGFFAKAASEYTQAWQLLPSRGDIGLKAAQLWKDRGDYAQSARILNGILVLPDNPAAADARQLLSEIQPALQSGFEKKLNEGLALMGRRDLAGAAQAFADASAISPTRSEPHLHLSRVYALQKNLNGATGEILQAVKRGNVSAAQLLAFDEFESWLQDKNFRSFLDDVYGATEVDAALGARRQRKEAEQRAQERRRELERRIPQLLQEANAAEESARKAAAKAQQGEYEKAHNSCWASIIGPGLCGSDVQNQRQKERENTEKAARLRQEASALEAERDALSRSAPSTSGFQPSAPNGNSYDATISQIQPKVSSIITGKDATGPNDGWKVLSQASFRISYPETWGVTGDGTSGYTMAPPLGASGNTITRGAVIARFQSAAGSNASFAELVSQLRGSNPGLQQAGATESTTVNGTSGKSIQLVGPQGTQVERDWLVAFRRSDGSLLYVIFVAPEAEFSQLLPTFEQMLRSLHVAQGDLDRPSLNRKDD